MKKKVRSKNFNAQDGMSLIAVMAIMVIFAIGLIAVAPTIMQEVQREKELESQRRGEEVADAIKQYIDFYQGAKLPQTMDDLLEGLPSGTKKRMILRPSAAVDPLSADGKWRLIKNDSPAFINFAKRVQEFNNGALPSNNSSNLDKYSLTIVNLLNTDSAEDVTEVSEEEYDENFDDTPFVGVASQSKAKSVVAYYGIENHSKWVFTPMFRGETLSVSPSTVRNANTAR